MKRKLASAEEEKEKIRADAEAKIKEEREARLLAEAAKATAQRAADAHQKGSAPTGNTLLQTMAEKEHGKWPLGAIAELIHNASDAEADTIRIRTHTAGTGAAGSQSLRIDDNGKGMGHGKPKSPEEVATGIHKLMQIGADERFLDSKEGQVGGYGVGAKTGMIAVAHSAVVFTIGNSVDKAGTEVRTVSVAFFSNRPFEVRNEPPITNFVTLKADDGEPIDGVSTKEQKLTLFEQIAEVDTSLTVHALQRWQGALQERGDNFGTSIFLIGQSTHKSLSLFKRNSRPLVGSASMPSSGNLCSNLSVGSLDTAVPLC